MIEAKNLTRIFRTYRKRPGFWGGVRGLFHREYEELAAANDISFSIKAGEFVGFLGPNGAGKTTVLKMLSGLIFPTSGQVTVDGFIPSERKSDYRRIFALVLGQKNQLWWDLPAAESFNLLRHIYDVPKSLFHSRLEELTTRLGVTDKLNVMVRELSLGERMKMELIAALLHGPRILFLDEPTIGLDVVSQRAVREFLREYNRKYQTTILLTSHYMADIKALCERVIVVHKGRKIHDGDLARLDSGPVRKLVKFRPQPGQPAEAWAALGPTVDTTDGELVLTVDASRVVEVCQQILAAGAVQDFTVEEVPLEDVIHRLFSAAD